MKVLPHPADMRLVAQTRRYNTLIALLACTTAFYLFLLRPAAADSSDSEPRNNFGGIGLIEMPSARMAPEGEISAGASFLRNNQHYYFGFQAMPWLETDFRYSGLSHNFASAGFPVYWDRSIALKARLWNEAGIIPAVALGINDAVGTGIYAGEYLVASKRLGAFDATVGLGWGRLGGTEQLKNPLGSIVPSFANRGADGGGQVNFATFFHGPYTGLFGGVVYHTPIDNLSLIAEYSSDAYVQEQRSHNLTPRNQMNFGASYQIDHANLGLAWIYGTTLSASIAFTLDPTTDPYSQHIGDPPTPPVHLRSPAEQQQAINVLLEQRQRPTGSVMLSPGGLNALSDALFGEINSVADVSTRGQILMMRISTGEVRAVCSNAASMVGRYGVDISAVIATDAAGKSARCAVQRSAALVNATLRPNFRAVSRAPTLTPAAILTVDASAPSQPSTSSAIRAITTDAVKQHIIIQAVSLTDSDAIIYYTNEHYLHEADAVTRLVRVLLADAPPNIEKFRLLPTPGGMPQAEFDVLRGPTERAITQTGSYNLLDNGNVLTDAPLQNPILSATLHGSYPIFGWTIFPQFRQELFDPSNPFAVQFVAAAQGTVELLPGLSAVAEGEANLYDNFNVNRPADSALPHVRTDWARFFTEGKNGLGMLQLSYLTRLAPDVFVQARTGYLENMYAGLGVEALWRPEGQRWAIGADVYHVQERAFDRLLGLQNYNVTTGHVTLYYASPWHDVNFQLRAGQYLAGDRGITFQASRRFSTGVELGMFFTKTNVSAAQFGEGSFDKGFIINIPLEWSLPISTQASYSTILRLVQRDGGQALDNDATLYSNLQRNGTAEIIAHAQDFVSGGE